MKTTSFPAGRKNSRTRFVPLATVAAAFAVAALGGCSKNDQADASATVKSAYADTKAAAKDAWADVKTFAFDQRDKFTANANALSSKIDAQVAEARANYSEDKASASRKAAMAELKNSEADYKAKVDALGHATADTWDSAKQNTIAAWDRLQADYDKARAD